MLNLLIVFGLSFLISIGKDEKVNYFIQPLIKNINFHDFIFLNQTWKFNKKNYKKKELNVYIENKIRHYKWEIKHHQ